MSRRRHCRSGLEPLEERQLLAAGPYLHVHNTDILAVVDAGSGELERIARMTGFQDDETAINDIAFSSSGRLYGISNLWLYEIDPVTGVLRPMGQHSIANPTALISRPDGTLQAMGRTQPDLYKLTVNEAALTSTSRIATLSDLDPTEGAEGDITYYQGDLVVATTDDRLIRYRFDVNPDRPRIIQQVDLQALEITAVFGLATYGSDQLYATTATAVHHIDISNPQSPSATKVNVSDTTFGSLRGAAYYAESGGPVPVGTLSGIKWYDRDRDGLKQTSEPTLSDWQVYIDTNLDGNYDVGEPLRRTDETGRFYFFGREPGLYTVDEIVPDPSQWQQTYPVTAHRNLVGTYEFDNGRADNQLSHPFGLPDLFNSLVSLSSGSATFGNVGSYLQLDWALGDSPFTIVLDANYNDTFGTQQYLVSQLAGTNNVDRDFQITADPTTRSVTSAYCDQEGVCASAQLGTIDSTEHRYAITWNGQAVGAFFDDELVTKAVTGTRPDLDGRLIRFGNPFGFATAAGLPGTVYQVRVFNRALTAIELLNAFETVPVANAYSVALDEERGIDGLNFGNSDPILLEPEIHVTRDTATGTGVPSGTTFDLGVAEPSDPPLEQQFWITNQGTTPLNIASVTTTAGFQIQGTVSTPLGVGASTSFRVSLTDTTIGQKSGEIRLVNSDDNENPYVILLTAEIIESPGPRQILLNTTAGNILRIDPLLGTPSTVLSGGPVLTDLAYNGRTNVLYGIDATRIYSVNLAAGSVTPLFTHNVQSASALAFSAGGQLYAAGADVYLIDLANSSSQKYADGGSALAGDLVFLGNQLLMSTAAGDLYEVTANRSTRLGSLSGVTMQGLVATDNDTLYGFADNRAYLINVGSLTLTPQFGVMIFSVAGATYQPQFSAHNDDEPLDVNGDTLIIPYDALLVINELNARLFTDPVTGRLVSPPQGDTRYPDVNDDGFVTPVDALLIINYLNTQPVAATAAAGVDAVLAEGESALISGQGALLSSLLDDLALTGDRRLRRVGSAGLSANA